jgi:biopolymer transport protein ExbD
MHLSTAHLQNRPFERHLIARQHKKSHRKKNMIVGLTLTSMVDMFSLLVIFLLQTFSTSPELLVMSKGVVLPTSVSALEVKDSPVLSLALDGVYLDQELVAPTEDVLKNPTPLMEKLEKIKETWMKSHPSETFKGEITLQAHKDIPSTTVSMIMAMLPGQGFGSILLAVITGG